MPWTSVITRMSPLYFSSRKLKRLRVVAACAVVLLVAAGIFSYRTYASPHRFALNSVAEASSKNITAGSGQPANGVQAFGGRAQEATDAQKAPIGEIHIANSGLVLLRGARVVSISGGAIRLNLILGSSHFTWTAETSTYTKFLTSGGEKKTLADIKAGDVVTVTGKLKSDSAPNTVDADFVRG